MKHCNGCNRDLDESQFSKDKNAFDGLHYRCKTCDKKGAKRYHKLHPETNRTYKLKRNYDLTPEEYEQMFIAQGGRCAICGRHQDDLDHPLAVDHDHLTGKVRGLICYSCNHVLGRVGDSIRILQAAIAYLERANNANTTDSGTTT